MIPVASRVRRFENSPHVGICSPSLGVGFAFDPAQLNARSEDKMPQASWGGCERPKQLPSMKGGQTGQAACRLEAKFSTPP